MYKTLLKILRVIPKRSDELKLVIGGLKDSGKSSILYQLSDNNHTVTVPTSGFNKQKFYYESKCIYLWDLGCNGSNTEFFWNKLSVGSKGLIYVVDISNPDNLADSAKELNRILSIEDLKGIPVLIYGNKKDQKVLSSDKVMNSLGKSDIVNRNWNYVETDAIARKGIDQGFKWLLSATEKTIVDINA